MLTETLRALGAIRVLPLKARAEQPITCTLCALLEQLKPRSHKMLIERVGALDALPFHQLEGDGVGEGESLVGIPIDPVCQGTLHQLDRGIVPFVRRILQERTNYPACGVWVPAIQQVTMQFAEYQRG